MITRKQDETGIMGNAHNVDARNPYNTRGAMIPVDEKQSVLITNTDEQENDRLVDRIRNRIEQINSKGENPRLSLSMGCAHRADGEPKNLQNVFKKTEDLMYKDKRNKKAVPT